MQYNTLFSQVYSVMTIFMMTSSKYATLYITYMSRCGTGDAGGLGPDLVSEVAELQRPEMSEDGVK